MRPLILILLFSLSLPIHSQVIGVGVSVDNTVIVEDRSVEAVNAFWSQKRYSEAMSNIQRAREQRISAWQDKPFFGQDLSRFKYMILLPPRKHDKDVKRNLIKKMKDLPITYVNVMEPYKTHDRMPEEVRSDPSSVLYLTVDLRAPYLVETYIQIYDSFGNLIYAMGREAMSANPAFNTLAEELKFALLF